MSFQRELHFALDVIKITVDPGGFLFVRKVRFLIFGIKKHFTMFRELLR